MDYIECVIQETEDNSELFPLLYRGARGAVAPRRWGASGRPEAKWRRGGRVVERRRGAEGKIRVWVVEVS